jgi:hypothetical protein
MRMALFAGSSGTARSARSFDTRERVTQLRRERTEQLTTVCPVAGLARLLQRGGGADTHRQTACAAPPSLCVLA